VVYCTYYTYVNTPAAEEAVSSPVLWLVSSQYSDGRGDLTFYVQGFKIEDFYLDSLVEV